MFNSTSSKANNTEPIAIILNWTKRDSTEAIFLMKLFFSSHSVMRTDECNS